jgi:NADPH:quinone reductase-like Zn-dependent oxidoreductase
MRMVEDLEQMRFKPVIDSVYPMHDLANAFRYEKAGRHFGKIVLTIQNG